MKVPANPPGSFTTDAGEHIRDYSSVLWRVFRTKGQHPAAWNELRHFGPVKAMRFDPHPAGPATTHPGIGVLYAASESVTAIGEAYQQRRTISRSAGGAAIVAWQPSRALRLLDLTTNWPVLNGAAASIMMGMKRYTQAWANAIDLQLGTDVDGLYSLSAVTGEPMVTLFSRVERVPAFPTRPRFHELLTDPAAGPLLLRAARRLGYQILK